MVFRLSQKPFEERVRTWLLEVCTYYLDFALLIFLCLQGCNKVCLDGPMVLITQHISKYEFFSQQGPPIHRFDTLKHLAPDNPVDEILEVLKSCAQLVQGLWVAKSSLVYDTNNGVEVLARNFVLYEFTKSTLIKKSVFGRRPEFLKAATPVLKSLAVERPDLDDWKLKELPDKKFENLYGDVVREQEAIWESMGKQINDIMHGGRNRPTLKNPLNPKANIPALSSSDKPTPTTFLRTSLSEEIRGALPKALQNVFRIHKVCR